MEHSILLESGTNELEILEFIIDENSYAINVFKVREVVLPIQVTKVPNIHPYIEGIIHFRGSVLPVIDIPKVLGKTTKTPNSTHKYIIAEFNKQHVAFHVEDVSQISRISWEQIEKPSDMYKDADSPIIGIVKKNDNIILLLDFERILVSINPDTGIKIDDIKKLGPRERSEKKIVIAEDSALLRKLLLDTITEAGYVNLEFFENGLDAYNYLESLLETNDAIEKHVQLVITDIEMPQMDGHHLTKKIKTHPELQKLPVLIFSSLIIDDLRHKGKNVGADDQISKPEIVELVQKIDKFIL